ncbi:TetR family transcriptional regulator [Reticulibacter mediterranei]|uniref:TetR family transcriptional regulator n=1 Tax=Reticulibacter mediterranei TaxID=2778369 RepID=A0A8J3N5V4_9CHLR|nr:TetR/AcrR family transcriptional regulator [Reticulibacter mediterranei]GHO99489.1 TetR family transcriptional regulator [Reticulibacter mediterranei]
MAIRQTDKRDRLIQTAVTLVYQQGFHQTTLADIAQHAQVPLGTVYYFFKTKEALGEAVVEYRLDESREQCQQSECDPDPRVRLQSIIQMMLDNDQTLAQNGCPIGTLCSELHKQGGPLAQHSSKIFEELLAWLTTQFQLMGKQDESEDLALHLLSAIEGAVLLSQSFQAPEYFEREAGRLKEWIRTL